MKIELKHDEVNDEYDGKYLKFQEASDPNTWLIISKNLEEGDNLIGYIERIRCGQWMQWCLLLCPSCYLSPGCNDEAREMQRILGSKNRGTKDE